MPTLPHGKSSPTRIKTKRKEVISQTIIITSNGHADGVTVLYSSFQRQGSTVGSYQLRRMAVQLWPSMSPSKRNNEASTHRWYIIDCSNLHVLVSARRGQGDIVLSEGTPPSAAEALPTTKTKAEMYISCLIDMKDLLLELMALRKLVWRDQESCAAELSH
jgi:hypothetical protein